MAIAELEVSDDSWMGGGEHANMLSTDVQAYAACLADEAEVWAEVRGTD